MTEKEKMLAGQIYDCGDKILLERWHLAKELQRRYNSTDIKDEDSVNDILNQLIGKRGKNVWISAPIYVDYGENIIIGDNVEINMACTFLDCNRITIGNNCGIGPGVHIYTVTHPVKAEERINKKNSFWNSLTLPVTIGNNVWIGGGSIILPGVTIGDNTTIGAGSVVTKSFPENVLVAGNPAKIIKKLV